jgi:RNA polymerase sigma-70 factor (ECF subfamily)
MRNPADKDLVDRIRAGDEAAVADLETGYGSRIFQLAFRYTRNREDAEEVAQDVLLKVYRNIDAFRGDSALSSWIYRITFNTAMSRLRTVKARATDRPDEHAGARLADDAPRGEVADWSALADDELLRSELRSRLTKALRDLPSIYRQPVLLRDVHGFSTEEASALLRVKDQTLKSRLHRGRLILRDQLSEFADGLAMHRPPAVPTRTPRRESETRH